MGHIEPGSTGLGTESSDATTMVEAESDAAATGHGSDTTTTSGTSDEGCEPHLLATCDCPNTARGFMRCLADGTDFEACDCPNQLMTGMVHKGPLVEGATVEVIALDRHGQVDGRHWQAVVADNTGSYQVLIGRLEHALIIARGRYFNEVSAQVSDQAIELRALVQAESGVDQQVHVNLLTHIVAGRALTLWQSLAGEASLEASIQRAEEELRAALPFMNDEAAASKPATQLALFGSPHAASAYLQLVSAAVAELADSGDGRRHGVLEQLVEQLVQDFSVDGQLEGALVEALARAQANLDGPQMARALAAYLGLAVDDLNLPALEELLDRDLDGHPDHVDNCPRTSNSDQANADGDRLGDVCDNCPEHANSAQVDGNGNGKGDSCDCGDGRVSGDEQCDDGNSNDLDGCLNTCTLAVCGDGHLGPNEFCDDGNTVDGDGCDGNCTPTGCGNGRITAGENCDDGNAVDGDGCDVNCTQTLCGNGIVSLGEACDDGNNVSGDGCDVNCRKTACGNGVATTGEQCDDGNDVEGDGCDSNCTLTACGNGIRSSREQCDDGNQVDGDGCDSDCAVTGCGNGIRTETEVCDDGNSINGDGCDNNCTASACGNGARAPDEGCDDGNLVDGDGCDSNCTVTACNNGIRAGDELCDDGNAVDGDGCDSNCTPTACGNGVVTAGEGCDDGNLLDADGCDSNCTETACGNGIRTGTEACDDGNAIDGDGCDSDCTVSLEPVTCEPWTRLLGGDGTDWNRARDIDIDGENRLYVVGATGYGDPMDDSVAASAGRIDAFLIRMSASGDKIWTWQWGTAQDDYGTAVRAAGDGKVYIVGTTTGTFSENEKSGPEDVYLRQYDSEGNEGWTRQWGTAAYDYVGDVAVDSEHNVYVAAALPTQNFGNLGFENIDFHVSKYDSAGTQAWAQLFGSSIEDSLSSIMVDPMGRAHIAGGTAPIDMWDSADNPPHDFYVARLDVSGSIEYQTTLGSAGIDSAKGVVADVHGNVYIVGNTYGTIDADHPLGASSTNCVVAKYDEQLQLSWVRQFGTPATLTCDNFIALHRASTLYVGGSVQGALPGETEAGGVVDSFVAKFTTNGELLWTQQIGASSHDSTHGAALDNHGRLYVVGTVGGPSEFMGVEVSETRKAYVTRICEP